MPLYHIMATKQKRPFSTGHTENVCINKKLFKTKNIKYKYSETYFQLQPLLKHTTGQQNFPPHKDTGLGLPVLHQLYTKCFPQTDNKNTLNAS